MLTVLFSAWIRRTKFGTGLIAIREDEGKAAAIGVNTTRFKVLAFAASSFFIGVAGGVYAYFLTFLNPLGAFAILGSVMIVLSALVGGRGTLYGPLVGAFIVQLINEEATVFGGGTRHRVLIMGLLLVLAVLFLPAGLLPTVQAAWRRRHPDDGRVHRPDRRARPAGRCRCHPRPGPGRAADRRAADRSSPASRCWRSRAPASGSAAWSPSTTPT